jgi:hypothetical protein
MAGSSTNADTSSFATPFRTYIYICIGLLHTTCGCWEWQEEIF